MAGAGVLLWRAFDRGDGAGDLPLWSLLLAAVWALGGTSLMLVSRRSRPSPTRSPSTGIAIGIIAAIALAVSAGSFIGGLVLRVIPVTAAWIDEALLTATSVSVPVTFVVALVAGAAEEVFFRLGFADLFSPRARWVIPNLSYVLVTLATGNLALAAVAPVLGVACTAAREFSGRRWAPIAVHATWTVAMVLLFPISVG